MIALVKVLIVVEKKFFAVVEGLEFFAPLRTIDVGHQFVQIVGRLRQQRRARLSAEVRADIVGDEKFHEILDGDSVESRQIVQGVDGRRDPAGLIVGVGLTGDIQMGGDKFLLIPMRFPQFFQILGQPVCVDGVDNNQILSAFIMAKCMKPIALNK